MTWVGERWKQLYGSAPAWASRGRLPCSVTLGFRRWGRRHYVITTLLTVDSHRVRERVTEHLATVRNDLQERAFVSGLTELPRVAEVLDMRARPENRPPHHAALATCRMVRTADGWLAVHLAREQDVESVPAVVADAGITDVGDPWLALQEWASSLSGEATAERLALLEDPAAKVGAAPPAVPERASHEKQAEMSELERDYRATDPTFRSLGGETRGGVRTGPPVVVDTTALWAGPLTARLLGDLGAEVLGDPAPVRPDPTAQTDPDHFRFLHEHHRPAAVDPASPDGRRHLEEQLATADAVLFSARPRALARLGLSPDVLRERHPHLLVVTLTAYGSVGAWADRPGLGDDVAASAGLVSAPAQPGGPPGFVGDAIADPITGFTAALETANALAEGLVGHLDVSMRAAAAAVPM